MIGVIKLTPINILKGYIMNASNFSVLQIVKDGRPYLLHIPIALPNPYDEAIEVAQEFALAIEGFKKQALARAEEEKLKQEMDNGISEVTNEK